MVEVELFTKPGCGWAERNFAALIEKKVAFRTVMSCDAGGRPTADFRAVSPYGKTPALRFGADSVWESSIINDYLDDLFPDPPLRPSSAGRRAEARLWIYHCDTLLIPALSALARSGASDDASDIVIRNQTIVAEWWTARREPGALWWSGGLSTVDIAFHTLFQTWDIVETMVGKSVPALNSVFADWKAATADHPSIRAAEEIGRSIVWSDEPHEVEAPAAP